MWRATLSNLTAHKVRFLATAAAIVLGVAFVVGTLILGDTLNATFGNLFGQTGAGIDVQVTRVQAFATQFGPPAGAAEGVPDDVVARIAEVEGVAAVEPTYDGSAQLVDAEGAIIGGQGPPTIGTDVPTVEELGSTDLREGRYPETAGEIAIDAATAAERGLGLGDTVSVSIDGPVQEQTLVGTVGFGDLDDLAGATVTLFDDDTARELFGENGAGTVAVLAEEGQDRASVRDRIAEEVGSDFEVLTGEEAAEANAAEIGQALGFLTTALLVFAGVSLLVGSFLIFNIFTITVAQRTRELALLRAVGASRRQVLASVLIEALAVGIAGAALGIGLGIATALGLRALLGQFGFALPADDLVVNSRTLVIAMVVGPVVTLVAALIPALRSTRVPPISAMRANAAPVTPRAGALRLILGAVILAAGVAALAAGLFADAGLPVVGTGAVLVLLAVAALSPLVTRPIARVLGAPVAATRGLPGTLARENTVRNTRRTASTAAALMIGLGLVTFVLIFTASLQESISNTIDEVFLADYSVAPANFISFPEEATEALAGVEGVAVVSRTKSATVGIEGDARTTIAIEPETFAQVVSLDVPQGDLADVAGGGVALDEALAADLGVGIGDTVDIAFTDPDAEEPIEVVAIMLSQQSGAQVIVSLDRFAEAVGEAPDSSASLLLDEGVTVEQARPALEEALAPFPTARLSDIADVREQITDQTNQLLGLVFALLFLSIIIALFGITNTLALSVRERTRELGLLRAIGMSRSQARTMVRWESVIVSLLGATLGLAVGLFFGWIFTRALEDTGLDTFAVPVVQLVIAVVLAGVAGVLAAVIPARSAARIDILRALAVE